MNRSTETSNIVFDINDESDQRDLLGEVLRTEIGQRFVKDYLTRERIEEYTPKIITKIQEYAKNPAEVEVEEAAKILDAMMESGKFVPKVLPPELPVEQSPAPVVEVDRNGRPLTEAQKAWREFRLWSDEHSAEECRQRARVDAAYGDYLRKTAERQFAATAPPDAVVPANARTREGKVGPNLQEFARLYIKEPLANLKPRNGFVVLAGEQISWTDFTKLQAAAAAKGLI